jgi:hypothetical protein
MNVDKALAGPRKNILENVAASVPQPAKMLNSESYAEGFGEGTEDAKEVVRYINQERQAVKPVYDFFDPIVMRLAWTEDFFKTIQADVEEYRGMSYAEAFYKWKNAFSAEWPNLLEEPESKLVEVDKIKNESIISALDSLLPQLDPKNKARLIEWAANNLNESKHLFSSPLNLDYDDLENYEPPQPPEEPSEPRPHNV